MRLPQKKANILIEALEEWKQKDLISAELKTKLQQTIDIIPFDWRRVARYSFIVAIIAFITSVVSIVSDAALMKLIEAYFRAPALIQKWSFKMKLSFPWVSLPMLWRYFMWDDFLILNQKPIEP